MITMNFHKKFYFWFLDDLIDYKWNKTKFGISKLPKYIKNVCTSQ